MSELDDYVDQVNKFKADAGMVLKSLVDKKQWRTVHKAFSNLRLFFELISRAVIMVEKSVAFGGKILSGKQKKQEVVDMFDGLITGNAVFEMFDGIVIGAILDFIIAFLNRTLGHDWIEKMK